MATKVTTAWGQAEVLEEIALPQEADGKAFSSIVQLLAGAEGERYVRFAYTTGDTARRGPVTLRAEDVARLHAELVERPGAGGGARARRRRRPGEGVAAWAGADDRGEAAAQAAASMRVAGGVDERREQERAVGRAEQRIDGVLRVRHQAHDVAAPR